MIIGGLYSFNNGEEVITRDYPHLWEEIKGIIAAVEADKYKIKVSEEKTTREQVFYGPRMLNTAFKGEFTMRGWANRRVKCEYPTEFYTPGYERRVTVKRAFRDIDFVKDGLGVEVQFGKYSFMVYNVAAKMTIFHKLGIINAGVEIVPMGHLVAEMSSGVSYFEQFVWDLEQRGKADIDIPVLVIGIDAMYSTPGEEQITELTHTE